MEWNHNPHELFNHKVHAIQPFDPEFAKYIKYENNK